MKAIVILDDCGHINVFECTLSNLFILCEFILEQNEINTILDDKDEFANAVNEAVNSSPIEERSERVIEAINDYAYTGRCGGNRINIVEVSETFNKKLYI